MLEIDLDHFGQVFQNLLSNAIKHTSTGGIKLQLEVEKKSVLISCKDTGGGIAKEDLPFIFERHFTKSHHPSVRGHGLSQSICREFIKRHNGEIWAEMK
ncbi:sensor histidine kinase [uncultured Metabacillus sp.]|uniref:sensor histidine kinase n=1 Tax=uncultured Metabacillus sp. TaxID=2860135 RepID=UPI00345C74BF